MLVVGIHNTGVTSSIAIARDGRILFGAADERFSRQKHSKYFPAAAMDRGLGVLKCSLEDVDEFAVAWNPAIQLAGRFRSGFSEWPAYAGARLYSNPNHVLPRLAAMPEGCTEQVVHLETGKAVRFRYVDHHLAHATTSFFPSPYEEAAILVADAYGERASSVFAVGRGTEIEVLRRSDFPHSLGSFYSAVTQFLGFRPDLDEWKVMGAAAHGDPVPYLPVMRELARDAADGEFVLDLSFFDHFNFDTPSLLHPRAHKLLGPPRKRDEPMESRHFDIAAAAQARIEEALFHLLKWFQNKTGLRRVCLGGGVAMNSVFNGRATLEGPFNEVFIPFAPDDSGNAIGAALSGSKRLGAPADALRSRLDPYLGPEYADTEIAETLMRFQISHEHVSQPENAAADLLASGKIVGWFQGRMEFGQRALGARSILADPRDPTMKDRINRSVKYREDFRPFAPAILEECVADYFEVPARVSVPFMERVFRIREAKRAQIPAVVHVDGTGRLQTVPSAPRSRFRSLIEAFHARTGVPVVLNTSFNTSSEPIVESPTDAVRTLYSSGLDALVIGSFVVRKKPL